MTTLYRAGEINETATAAGQCWAREEESAALYLDRYAHGATASRVMRTMEAEGECLDLTGATHTALDSLSSALGEDLSQWVGFRIWEVIEDIRPWAALAAAGYDWVAYDDEHEDGAQYVDGETWVATH